MGVNLRGVRAEESGVNMIKMHCMKFQRISNTFKKKRFLRASLGAEQSSI